MRRALIVSMWGAAAALMVAGCQAQIEGPLVQVSSTGDPGGNIVAITPEGAFGPPCLVIDVGETVEFRNESVDLPANITSLGEPVELYSPSLVEPYNIAELDGAPFSWWRHTFESAGVFEYYDTNQGEAGRKVVDPYYGTVTLVGIADGVRTGVVCAEEPGSNQCDGVCCIKASDCPGAQCCETLERKLCVLPDPNAALCDGDPAHREFSCFGDDDCPSDPEDPSATSCLVETTHTCADSQP